MAPIRGSPRKRKIRKQAAAGQTSPLGGPFEERQKFPEEEMVRGAGFEGGYHEPIFRGFLESVRIAAHPLPFKDGPCDAMPAGLPPVPIGQGKPWLEPG